MARRNLWGKLPVDDDIVTPTQLIKEQASHLSDLTRGVLQGEVSVTRNLSKFEINLFIVAPFLDNYQYTVFWATHSLELWPVTVSPGWERFNSKQHKSCATAEELEATLGEVLSSEQVQRVVSSLLAQSRSM